MLGRARPVLVQALLLLAVAALAGYLVSTLQRNLLERNIASGFGFLSDIAGFSIGESEIAYSASDTFKRALLVGVLNTLKVSALAIIGATLLGAILGLARVSDNPLVRGLARLYVEVVRNIPLLVQLLFLYAFVLNAFPPVEHAFEPLRGVLVSNRGVAFPSLVLEAFRWELPERGRFNIEGGIQLSAELMTLVVGLSIYTAAYIAEIIRAGVESVPFGQGEAGEALALSQTQVMRHVVMPQALRAILPPLTSWYLNTVKNSSLAIAVGYPDLLSVVDTIINQTGQAVEGVLIVIVVYLAVNLLLSLVINRYNAVITRRGFAAGSAGARAHAPVSWKSLVGSWRRSTITIGFALLVCWAAFHAVDWLVISAAHGSDAVDCRGASGACWPFIHANYRTILFGTFPHEEQWRAAVCVILFMIALGLSFVRRLWGRPIAIVWLLSLAAMVLLLRGGWLGMPSVPTERWSGLPLTLLLASLAVTVAFPFSVLLALGRQSNLLMLRSVCVGFIEFMRGVPLVGLLFMAAVLFPLFAPPSVEIDSFIRVQVALILFTAAYMAEAVRGGLQAIPHGQFEAAAALGLSGRHITTHVVLPQALRISIPGLVNTSISEVKNTTLVLIVGMFDVLQATRLALVDVQWRPYFLEAYLFTATLFFGICFAISQLSRRIERHLNVAQGR